MSLQLITFKHTNVEPNRILQNLTEEKLRSLNKYFSRAREVKCEVEFEKIAPHQNGTIYRAEANLWRAGTLFRAEATKESFEQAIDEVKQELDKELRRSLNRRQTRIRSGARQFKEQLLAST